MAINILNNYGLCYSASFILFHPKTTLKELKFNIDKIEALNMYNKVEKLFNRLLLIPGTKINPNTVLLEWKFEQDNVKDIYHKCIKFQERNSYIMNNLENLLLESEDPISSMLKLFDFCINKKYYEFMYLKSLVMKSKYYEPETSIYNKKIYINNNLIIEKENDKKYLCFSTKTGLIYEISINILNFMKDINGTLLEFLCKEIIDSRTDQMENSLLILKYIVNLLKEELLIIKEVAND